MNVWSRGHERVSAGEGASLAGRCAFATTTEREEEHMAGKPMKDITREGVLAAVAECDRLGRDAFLAKHGYRPSKRYRLVVGRRSYDSKAIVGVAMGKTAAEFSGGAATVQRRLERLGFRVRVES
jgi:hypothetical protein